MCDIYLVKDREQTDGKWKIKQHSDRPKTAKSILSLHLFSVNWYICFLSYEIKHSLHAKMNGKFYIKSEHFRIRNSP